MGIRGRLKVIKEFDDSIGISKYLSVIEENLIQRLLLPMLKLKPGVNPGF